MVRVGLIGYGRIGAAHLNNLLCRTSGVQAAAVCSPPNPEKEAQVQSLGLPYTSDAEALIDSKDIDAVLIASPDETHEELVLRAIRRGKYVFCEKPLALTTEGCRRIIEAEEAAGKQMVQVGFMRRYDKHHQEMKRLLREGAIGELLLIHAVHRTPQVSPQFTTETSITGALIHELDVINWLTGRTVVSSQVLRGRVSRFAHPGLADPLLVQLQLDSGCLASIEVFVTCQYGYDIQLECVGETGVLALPSSETVIRKREARRSVREYDAWQERYSHAFERELQEWAADIRRGELRGPGSGDALAAALAADQCPRSLAGEVSSGHITREKENDCWAGRDT